MQSLIKFILKRPFFRGQDRLFNYFFTHHQFKQESVIVSPIEGDFKIHCDASTWIGAKIIYLGDYQPELKQVFKAIIKKGDQILDIGANIGFHTLYFAQLTGKKGTVTAFEPVPQNYQALNENVKLNAFENIITHNIALSNQNEQLTISADVKSTNPGSHNLFEKNGNVPIKCLIGDEFLGGKKVDFIKIDVEGYESYVLDGLVETIKENKPKIIFEYDKHYHQKTGRTEDYIFSLLHGLGYHFKFISRSGFSDIDQFTNLVSGNILALPNG